jgi:chromosome segregation ATPase
MPDDDTTSTTAAATGDAGQSTAASDAATGGEDVTALKNAFDRQKAANAALKAERDELKAARDAAAATAAAAEQARLAEQGDFKTIAEKAQADLAAANARLADAEAREAELAETREAVKAQVEAQKKALKLDDATVELLDGKTPAQQLAWLAKHAEELAKRNGVVIPTTPRETSPPGKLSEAEREAHIARSRRKSGLG